MSRAALFIVPVIVAVYTPMCPAEVRPTIPAAEAPIAQLWQPPLDLSTRDRYYGPWGPESAPDAHATYTLVDEKTHGFNPGVVVTDSEGRRWHVKQAPPFNEPCAEGPVEVVLSRVLLASLTERQWADAFRAGGYQPAVARRFIVRLHEKISDGLAMSDEHR